METTALRRARQGGLQTGRAKALSRQFAKIHCGIGLEPRATSLAGTAVPAITEIFLLRSCPHLDGFHVLQSREIFLPARNRPKEPIMDNDFTANLGAAVGFAIGVIIAMASPTNATEPATPTVEPIQVGTCGIIAPRAGGEWGAIFF